VVRHADDPFLAAAVMSSIHPKNIGRVLGGVLSAAGTKGPPANLSRQLLKLAVTMDEGGSLAPALKVVTTPREGKYAPWQMAALAGVMDALERRGQTIAKW